MRNLRYYVRGAFWVGVYLFLVAAPLLILMFGPVPVGRGFWREFSVALGFAGLAMMGIQFGLTARFRYITSPFGIDVIYHFHRQISVIAFGLIVAHVLILFASNPETLALLNPITAPWRARFGLIALIAVTAIIVTSLWRLNLKLHYEAWRLSHSILAVLAVLFAMLHIVGVGHYVDTPVKQVFWIALTVSWIGILVYVRVVKPILMLRKPYSVEKVIEERGDCYTLVLKPEGHDGIKFRPGQFAWLTLWNTPFHVREHPFSIASSAEHTEHICLTIKNLGDFTSTIKDVPQGKRAYLDGPYGQFTIDREPSDIYVFLAGGIGITPMMSMLRTLADRGDQRQLFLIFGNPDWESVTFREELEELQKRLNLKVIHALEEPPEVWDEEEGFITEEIIKRHVPGDLHQHQYFICGPDPMMDAVEMALDDLRIPLTHYHSERYNLI